MDTATLRPRVWDRTRFLLVVATIGGWLIGVIALLSPVLFSAGQAEPIVVAHCGSNSDVFTGKMLSQARPGGLTGSTELIDEIVRRFSPYR